MNSKQKIDRRSFLGRGGAAASVLMGATKALTAARNESGEGPVVETGSGKIRGVVIDKVYAFKGVPYGASTAGAGRFMPPVKPQPWTEIKDTTQIGHRSPQQHGILEPLPEVGAADRQNPMGEDCLVVNVWSNGLKGSRKRPVMVWLHGGGFASGSGDYSIYDGANMARKRDVVVVTVNHRLNVFGYLYLADVGGAKYADASNAGHRDIVLALEWVRDNIANFGGDPANVTIFGQSGGGGKVATLMAMPAAKGLFHRAICQSGASIKGMSRENATKTAQGLLTKLNLKPDQLDQLQNMPFDQLTEAIKGVGGLAPVVDGKTLPHDPFDPGAPEESATVPLLIGTVEEEINFFAGTPLDPIDDASLHTRVKQTTRTDDATADRLIAVYKKGRPNKSNVEIYQIIASDATFSGSVHTEADRKVAQGKAPVYKYYFTWQSTAREGKLRSFHTLEIPFVFENVDEGKSMTGSGQDRYALSDKMSAAWTAFARTGNPNVKGLPHWPAFTADQRATMIFNDESKLVNDPYKEERLAIAALPSVGRGRG